MINNLQSKIIKDNKIIKDMKKKTLEFERAEAFRRTLERLVNDYEGETMELTGILQDESLRIINMELDDTLK